MADRLDAIVAREYLDRDGNKKSSFTKIGADFAMKNGGWSVSLDALPLPAMGERGLETRILLMEPKPREGGERRTPARRPNPDDPRTSYGDRASELDTDEVPF